MKATLPLLLAALAVTGCATAAPTIGGDPELSVVQSGVLPEPSSPEAVIGGRSYVVSPGDKLAIDVQGIAALEKLEVRVDSAGWIAVPVAGPVEVGGQNIDLVEELIARRLRERFVRNPVVTANVSEMAERLYAVEGQVRTPGLYPIRKRMSLLQAIAQAQGTDEFSKLNDVVIFRTIDGQRYAGLYDLKAIRHGAYPDPDVFAEDIVTVGDSKARRLFKDVLQVVPLLTTPLVVAIDKT